ncbi:Major facilitator superfamily domain-containing protein 12 [Mytilus coruscus]|uniref:Major facilitator superfamily domain-containing protein 12 n=1 Tax=Mytilus coruscus TaxID=42192 RepID=A0A6J8ABB1_MYTCO|nr:Major facilitator superfamily domain-containing protein 12 [Mytilus coruscus]
MSSMVHKLPVSQRLGFSIGHVLNDLTASMWFSYLIIYFHQVKRFNNILAGLLMLIGQVSDALFTPFIGFESDSTVGICNLGKRKSWHFVGTLCVIGSFPFIFNKCIECGNSPDWAQFIYYAPFVVIFQFGWASVQINHLSLIPDLTPDEGERVELNGMRYAFTVISNLIVFGVFWLLFDLNEGNKDATMLNHTDSDRFRNLVFIAVAIGIVFSFIFHLIVREKVKCNQEFVGEEPGSSENLVSTIEGSMLQKTLMTWRCWLKEIQFYQIAVIYMCTRLFVNVSQIYLPLYITETLRMEKDNVAVMPLVVYVSGFFTSLVMRPLNKKIGRKATYFVGIVFAVSACIWMYFLGQSTSKQTYGAAVLLGIGGSTMLVTSLSMTADMIGENTESGGFVYGSMSFTDKLSNGIAVTLIQFLHPCTACCPHCNEYYRTILAFVPASVAVVAFVGLLTLLPTKLVRRLEPIVSNGTVKSQENNTNLYYDNEDDTRQPLLRKKTPSINNS